MAEIELQPTPTPSRKGATRRADISSVVLQQMNAGEIEATTLAETLAVDFRVLMKHASPDTRIKGLDPKTPINTRMRHGGELLFTTHGAAGFERFRTHASDTVRGWAAYLLAATPRLTLTEKLQAMRPLAGDPHSGVREWAWLALREEIVVRLDETLTALLPWTAEDSPFLRRFACEATRPRGIGCAHSEILKRNPEIGLPMIEPLRADPEKYVQDSVANWLNDAAKTKPEWVEGVCVRWRQESPGPETLRVIKRALRSL